MNLFRGNESGGKGEPVISANRSWRRGGAVAGTLPSAHRTKHGRRDDDAGALYRAVSAGDATPRLHAEPCRRF